jgi:hypothetical protein
MQHLRVGDPVRMERSNVEIRPALQSDLIEEVCDDQIFPVLRERLTPRKKAND